MKTQIQEQVDKYNHSMILYLDGPLKQKDKDRMNYARVIVVGRKGENTEVQGK